MREAEERLAVLRVVSTAVCWKGMSVLVEVFVLVLKYKRNRRQLSRVQALRLSADIWIEHPSSEHTDR
jgi:hypothetical protein